MNMLVISSNSLFNKDNQEINKSYLKFYLSEESNQTPIINDKNFLPVFNYSCNLMKEIEIEKKDEGLNLMEKLIKFPEFKEELFTNAYVLDKNYIKLQTQSCSAATDNKSRHKPISVGDYQISGKAEGNENTVYNYGFFSNVLEDENKQLKIKIIELIYKICSQKSFHKFSKMSYNYLIEMINDDEDDVRFKTLEILIELIEIFKVSDSETIWIILFNLKENSQLLRKYLYKLISKVYVNKTVEFKLVLEQLKCNAERFSDDKNSIFECLKSFSENNFKLLTKEFIVKLLNLDDVFYKLEIPMNDSKYINNLIVFQTFMLHFEEEGSHKNTDLDTLYVPKVFVKHFNFWISKYPSIFSLDSLKKLQAVSERSFLQKKTYRKSLSDNTQLLNSKMNLKFLNQANKNDEHINSNNKDFHDSEIGEIINSLTKSGKKIKIIEIYMKIFDLLEYVPCLKHLDLLSVFISIADLLEKIFLKFRLENKKNKISEEINSLNKSIISLFKFYLFNDLDILLKKPKLITKNNSDLIQSNEKKESKTFDFHSALAEFIISNNAEKIKQLKIYFYENFNKSLNDNLCFFGILLPKNNSIFKHSIKNENLPFFLEIKMKISNIEYSDNILMELIKNIDITLIDLNDEIDVIRKNIPLSFSNTEIFKNEFERSVIVKIKCSIYLYKAGSNKFNRSERFFNGNSNNNNMNFEISVRLKNRFFKENHDELIRKLSNKEENVFSFHLEEDLFLTDRVNFTINK